MPCSLTLLIGFSFKICFPEPQIQTSTLTTMFRGSDVGHVRQNRHSPLAKRAAGIDIEAARAGLQGHKGGMYLLIYEQARRIPFSMRQIASPCMIYSMHVIRCKT
jgi:hypothetical protein